MIADRMNTTSTTMPVQKVWVTDTEYVLRCVVRVSRHYGHYLRKVLTWDGDHNHPSFEITTKAELAQCFPDESSAEAARSRLGEDCWELVPRNDVRPMCFGDGSSVDCPKQLDSNTHHLYDDRSFICRCGMQGRYNASTGLGWTYYNTNPSQ